MKKRYLLAPGPTPVPSESLLAMARPIIHHRTPEFSKTFAECAKLLKYVFQTKQDVLMLSSSGTGAMDAAISNLFSPGDEVIAINGGKFGERWGQIAEAYGLKVHWIKIEWGTAVNPNAVEKILKANPAIRGVLSQASETSTTASHPIEKLAKLTKKRDCLLIVDGITAVGVADLPMDKAGIDVLISGSQKAFMLPPGLAFIALSKKAWKFNESSTCPRYYLDLAKEKKNIKKDTSAYTPAVSLINGLKEALLILKDEGLENTFKRHAMLAEATRAGAKALGLKLLAPKNPSTACTGVYLPEKVDGAKFVKFLRDEMGVTIAGGQDHLKGKIIRLAHLGYIDTFDVIIGLAAVEMALNKFGHKVALGKGVAAAQKILVKRY
jgi:aspartate aminotransferase-like enzyme